MNNFLTIIVLLITVNSFAQTRYLDSLFVAEKTDAAIVYGTADALNAPYLSDSWTYSQDLLMDVYQPQGDVNEVRPCVLFIHGGAFLFGSREDANGVNVCKDFVKKGYVAVSIDYRMGLNTFSAASAERAVYRAVQDTKAAIRFLKENYATYGIDTTRIFAMGSSAGSISAIHAAYFEEDERANIPSTLTTPDLGCISCSGNTFVHDDKPIAIANLWGAIVDTTYIEVGDVPMISFHGTDDFVVSPDSANPFSSPFFPSLSGANYITPRLQNLGITTEYYKFYGQGHEPWGVLSETPYYDSIMDLTTLFFYNYLQNNPSNTVAEHRTIQNLTIYPNPTTDLLNIDLSMNTKSQAYLQVLNSIGQTVYSENLLLPKGNNQVIMNTTNWSSGLYFLNLKSDNQQMNRVVVKR
ncbi:MAG: carboxylesterase family protein [Saprospiraceae bacterium]